MAHPAFPGLLLHSDDELAHELGAAVVERRTVHAWPLSCVQRVVLSDGRALAYKSQLPPTVEPEFYAAASSPLLTRHRLLGRLGACRTMALHWLRSPLLRRAVDSPDELVRRTREVVGLIGDIAGDPPVHLDAGSGAGWTATTSGTVEKLAALLRAGRFAAVSPAAVDQLRDWCGTPSVLATISTGRLIHGDLRADQIFVTSDGYRVVDWQRPVVAPPDVDLVSVLVGERIDPSPHVSSDVIAVFWFLRLQWAVQAQHDLFPDFRGALFEEWAAGALGHVLRVER